MNSFYLIEIIIGIFYLDSTTLNQLAPEEGLGLQDGGFDPSKYPVPENPYKELLIF